MAQDKKLKELQKQKEALDQSIARQEKKAFAEEFKIFNGGDSSRVVVRSNSAPKKPKVTTTYGPDYHKRHYSNQPRVTPKSKLPKFIANREMRGSRDRNMDTLKQIQRQTDLLINDRSASQHFKSLEPSSTVIYNNNISKSIVHSPYLKNTNIFSESKNLSCYNKPAYDLTAKKYMHN